MDHVEGRQRTLTREALNGVAASALAFVVLAAAGCTSRTDAGSQGPALSRAATDRPAVTAPDGRALLPVSLPDLSKMTASVQRQIRAAHESLSAKVENRQTPSPSLADAYGELGKLLMVADYPEAAEPCFLNAQTLASNDARWPYYLAHQYRKRGELDKARTSFEQALRLHPDDVAALVWLGDVALAQGSPDAAEPRF